jgi:hypothetical protein
MFTVAENKDRIGDRRKNDLFNTGGNGKAFRGGERRVNSKKLT